MFWPNFNFLQRIDKENKYLKNVDININEIYIERTMAFKKYVDPYFLFFSKM